MNYIIAIIIVFIWLIFGAVGMYQHYYRKFAWSFIIFLIFVPFLGVILTLLLERW